MLYVQKVEIENQIIDDQKQKFRHSQIEMEGNDPMETGVARKAIVDMEQYSSDLSARLNPSEGLLQKIFQEVKENPKRVIFAEGEDENLSLIHISEPTRPY